MKKNDLIYRDIENHILNLIKIQTLKEGDCLPPERELGKKFKASQIPVRQAIRSLVEKNVLVRIPHKGTFVKKGKRTRVKTNKIGVLYHFHSEALFQDQFYGGIFGGINDQAQKEERMLVLHPFRARTGPETNLYELRDEVDGFILLDPSHEVITSLGQALAGLDKPAVVLNYEGTVPGVDQVMFDSYANMTQLIEFLIGLGHGRIGFVHGQSIIFDQTTNPNFLNRVRAYRDALQRHGLETGERPLLGLTEPDEKEQLAARLSGKDAPTALVCSSDYEALRVCRLARELGLSVPRDVTVTGYDGVREAETAWPPLTTLSTPLAEMGRRGVEIISGKLRDPGRLPARVVLPGTLVPRQSHAAYSPDI